MAALTLALLAMQIRVGPPDPVLSPVDPAAAIELFERVCVTPFPDSARFDAAIAREAGFARWQPQGPLEALVPGQFWQSAMASVRYSSGSSATPELPHPQCTVTARAAAAMEAERLFPLLTARLGLAAPKLVGHSAFRTAIWDLRRDTGRWRILFGPERRGDGLTMKLTMMNLGTGK